MKKSILDQDSASPLYMQLMRKLRNDITSGVYPVHSRIPAEQELCETYQISRVTVRKALSELTREGLLERHQGKGTFVSIPRLRLDLRSINSFNDVCAAMDRVPSTQVVQAQLAPAHPYDREIHLEEQDEVVEIVRVRQADGLPVMLETNRFPKRYSWLLEEDLTGSLYGLLRSRGVEPEQAIHEISLCYASAQEAKWLGVEPGTALLALDETIYDQDGHPLHTSRQRIRGDRFTFRI